MSKPKTLLDFLSGGPKKSTTEREKTLDAKKHVTSALEEIRELEGQHYAELISIANSSVRVSNLNRGFILDIDYDGDINKAIVKLYDLESDKVFIYEDDTGHSPYMLTDLPEDEILNLASKYGLKNRIKSIEPIEKYNPITDKTVQLNKVVVKTPQDVGGSGGRRGLRSILGEEHSWESRIKYYLCYLYDRPDLWPSSISTLQNSKFQIVRSGHHISEIESAIDPEFKDLIREYIPVLTQEIPKLHFIALDIEVASAHQKIPDPKNPVEPIVAVSLVSFDPKTGRESLTVYLLADLKKQLDRFENLNTKNLIRSGFLNFNGHKVKVLFYPTEKLMLIDIFRTLWETPVLVTFNGDNFDLYYMYSRGLYLGIDRKYIPLKIQKRTEVVVAELKRGLHIDLYKFYSNGAIKAYVFKDSYESVSLEELAYVLLGEHKLYLHVDIQSLTLEELAKYNVWDAYLTARLLTFSNWLPWKVIVTLSRITKFPIKDITRRGVSSWIGNWFYAEMRKRNWLIPNEADFQLKQHYLDLAPRPQPVIKGKRYRGAIVFQPKAGIWFNVYVLDFASIYPTIIKVHNISFETVLCPHEECKDNKVIDLDYWICKKRRGLASLLVGFIRDLRVKYYKKRAKTESDPEKRELYHAIQSGLKVLINASYGVFGTEIFNLYFLPVAESITAIGRHKILSVANKARELNLDVIYGDTDSIFIHDPPKETVDFLISWASEKLKVDLEIDKIYIFVAFSERKKNYFGLLKDGSLDIKGLLGKKRNTPEFLKREFAEVLEILRRVRTKEDIERAKKEIEQKIVSIFRNLAQGRYKLSDLAFRVMLSKPIDKYTKTTPEHVKAAKKLKREVQPGEVIAYVKCRDGPYPVELLERDPNWRRKIDLEKYFEYTHSVFDQLLDALGLKIEELEKKAKGITDISSFF